MLRPRRRSRIEIGQFTPSHRQSISIHLPALYNLSGSNKPQACNDSCLVTQTHTLSLERAETHCSSRSISLIRSRLRSMASLVHHQAAPMPMPAAAAAACGDDDAFMPQSFGCFGRSLSRASSGRRLEYRALSVSGGESEETRSRQERSARAKLRWKAVAQEIIMASRRGGSGGGSGGAGARRSRKAAALPAFSYDSRSYALNFDQGAADE